MNRPFAVPAVILTLALIAAGCGMSTSPTSPLARNQLKAEGLHILATVSGPSGGAVGFSIGVENRATSLMTLVFSSSQFFDIEVSERSGEVVWRWSNGLAFLDSFWDLGLKSGESYVRAATWDLKDNLGRSVPPGTYTCRIWITNHPRDEGLVTETSLTI